MGSLIEFVPSNNITTRTASNTISVPTATSTTTPNGTSKLFGMELPSWTFMAIGFGLLAVCCLSVILTCRRCLRYLCCFGCNMSILKRLTGRETASKTKKSRGKKKSRRRKSIESGGASSSGSDSTSSSGSTSTVDKQTRKDKKNKKRGSSKNTLSVSQPTPIKTGHNANVPEQGGEGGGDIDAYLLIEGELVGPVMFDQNNNPTFQHQVSVPSSSALTLMNSGNGPHNFSNSMSGRQNLMSSMNARQNLSGSMAAQPNSMSARQQQNLSSSMSGRQNLSSSMNAQQNLSSSMSGRQQPNPSNSMSGRQNLLNPGHPNLSMNGRQNSIRLEPYVTSQNAHGPAYQPNS